MKTLNKLTLGITLISIVISCGSSKTKFSEYPEVYSERPKTILVLPPVNNTTAADAKDLLRTTVAPALAEKGYYVLPIEPIFDFLKLNGAYSIAETSEDLPLDKFFSIFEADAVLKITINKWDKNYYVVAGNVKVDLAYELVSARSGKTIWSRTTAVTVDTTSNSSGSIFVDLVATAINTGATKYIDIAKRAHLLALADLPAGFYSPMFQKDKAQKVN